MLHNSKLFMHGINLILLRNVKKKFFLNLRITTSFVYIPYEVVQYLYKTCIITFYRALFFFLLGFQFGHTGRLRKVSFPYFIIFKFFLIFFSLFLGLYGQQAAGESFY